MAGGSAVLPRFVKLSRADLETRSMMSRTHYDIEQDGIIEMLDSSLGRLTEMA